MSDPHTDAALAELLDDLGIPHDLTPLTDEWSDTIARMVRYAQEGRAKTDLTPYCQWINGSMFGLAVEDLTG